MRLRFSTVEQYDQAISNCQSAIDRQMLIGVSTSNNSGGSSRSMSEANLNDLEKYLSTLLAERDQLVSGCAGGLFMNVGW